MTPDNYNQQKDIAEGREQAMPAIKNLLTQIDRLRIDRDEWKQQHENLLAMFKASESALTAARIDIERHVQAAAERDAELRRVHSEAQKEISNLNDCLAAAEAELAAMREAFEPLLRYPGLREYVGTILFDAATAAIAKERT